MKPYDLAEAALRGRLFARDRIEGDRIEGERAFLRAAGESRTAHVAGPTLLRETREGGRYAPMHVGVGDRAGNSVVLEDAGRRPSGERLWLITCSGCGRSQIRGSGSINVARRTGRELLCPGCMLETGIGVRMERASLILERVLAGGPVYTDNETRWLQDKVLEDLEAAFGAVREPMDEDPGRWQTAAGYPWSAGGNGTTLATDNSTRRSPQTDHRRKEAAESIANQSLARLANAIASGDREAILTAEDEVAGRYRRRGRAVLREEQDDGDDIEDRVGRPVDMTPAPCATRVARTCFMCGQKFCGTTLEIYCSRRCVAREAAWSQATKVRAVREETEKLKAQNAASVAAAKAAADAKAAMKAASAQLIAESKRQNTVAAFRSLIGSVARSEPGCKHEIVCARCGARSAGAWTPEEAVHKAIVAGFRGLERTPGALEPACSSCQRVRRKPSDVYRFSVMSRYLVASKGQPHLFMTACEPWQGRRWGSREEARKFTVEEIDREIYIHEADDLYFVVVGTVQS